VLLLKLDFLLVHGLLLAVHLVAKLLELLLVGIVAVVSLLILRLELSRVQLVELQHLFLVVVDASFILKVVSSIAFKWSGFPIMSIFELISISSLSFSWLLKFDLNLASSLSRKFAL